MKKLFPRCDGQVQVVSVNAMTFNCQDRRHCKKSRHNLKIVPKKWPLPMETAIAEEKDDFFPSQPPVTDFVMRDSGLWPPSQLHNSCCELTDSDNVWGISQAK